MHFPKNPSLRVQPQSAAAVRGYWYWLMKDGGLLGGSEDTETGLWNHFEIMCRMLGVSSSDKKVVAELHPLYQQGELWMRYRALRVSISLSHSEVNVQIYGRPTIAQFDALRTLYYRNRQRVAWDLGIQYRKELSGAGSFPDFQSAVEKHFGKSSH